MPQAPPCRRLPTRPLRGRALWACAPTPMAEIASAPVVGAPAVGPPVAAHPPLKSSTIFRVAAAGGSFPSAINHGAGIQYVAPGTGSQREVSARASPDASLRPPWPPGPP